MTIFETSNVRGKVLLNTSLAKYNTWGVGGNAECVFTPADLKDLAVFLAGTDKQVPVTWLGLGSNVLVRDKGIAGVVIITQNGLRDLEYKDNGIVYAQAGLACAKLARNAISKGFTGVEFMAGIPGTVGGALAMNAGAFGGQTWEKVVSVDVINRDGEIKTRQAEEFDVEYRSVKQRKDEWFVGARFLLSKKSAQDKVISIKDLLEKRSATQPIGKKNCGSVFKNPQNTYAARLIEQSGLKGYTIGGACVSEKHANFIINEDDASAKDIEDLITYIQKTVQEKHGIGLETEVIFLGDKD